MENIGKDPVVYWDKKVPDTNLERLQRDIEKKYNVEFETYWEFHRWTIENYSKFLEELWNFLGIIASEPYKEVWVKTGEGFLDNEWFSGAKLNYAENVLRIRDETIALICLDELGNEEKITYAEMFEEVKLYAAAFKKNGLKTGDSVACFMSNRKEAIFAMLATASIGAIWGGPVPYYGARAASNIVRMMDAKFLITIDSHQDNGMIFQTLDCLPEIVKSSPTLEKVVLLVTKEETRKKDLKNIRNCVFLEDFLNEGREADGKVPDLIFEQLPFDHPLCVNFTSGTTGLPKAAVHSIGTMMTIMQNHAISYNMKRGDVICTNYPVGWTLWDSFIPSIGLGVTFFLYCGSLYYTLKGHNFWDLIAKYRVKTVILITSQVDKMEKMEIFPSQKSDMSFLKLVVVGGSPVKNHNFEYLKNKVKKDLFVGIVYGATELFGCSNGFNLNMPVHGGEIQVPSLGVDLQCYDNKGNSVVGKIGEGVVCTPAVNFPIYLWKDVNKKKITEIYLSKFPGVWLQHDECWINPKTRGMVIIGRSDDTLKQKGERFGAADIYFAIHSLDELQDYVCVSQQKYTGDSRAVLFVKMKPGLTLTPEIRKKMEKKVDEELWEDCVPELIVEVPEIPYNLNNKRMESLIRKIVETNKIPEVMNIRNPDSLKYFLNIPEIVNYNKK